MRGTNEDSLPAKVLRLAALLAAAFMVCAGVWLVVPEIFRDRGPLDAQPASASRRPDPLLETAAAIGLVRGDLWADYAETFAIPAGPAGTCDPVAAAAAKAAAKALSLSPHDARVWLVLAAAERRCEPGSEKAAGAMRMSFYTGANEIALIPERLRLALDSPQINEPEFRRLVYHDVQTAIVNRPELRPAVIDIYAKASPAGREALRQAVGEFAPRFDLGD